MIGYKMNRRFTNKNIITISICCFAVSIILFQAVSAVGRLNQRAEGLRYYRNNEPAKAIEFFKAELVKVFPAQGPAKPQEDEKVFLSQLDDEKTSALANYKLGLIYEAQSKTDQAATMFKNALTILSSEGARYEGAESCKNCHLKEWESWKKTKMAKTFDRIALKESKEETTTEKDPKCRTCHDNPKCLSCHTTGFRLPGGYRMPKEGDLILQKNAKEHEGVTCEACHGPGSKHIAFQKGILDKDTQTFKSNPDAEVCAKCHNRRKPYNSGPDFHFDYEKERTRGLH